MIFELKQKKNKSLDETYKKSMKELDDFYGIRWERNLPNVFILKSRKEINVIRGKDKEDWVVGWAGGFNTLYLLDYTKIKTESSHKEVYSKEKYNALIKHELSHLFFNILIKQGYSPIWLNEGVAIHLSGQNKFKKEITEFKTFLTYYEKGGGEVYLESGFFVEILIEKYGKDKFLKFLKSLKSIKNRKEFDALFFKTYKFKLNYKEINKMLV